MLRIVVLIHLVVCLANVFAVVVLPLRTPWYISVPLLTYLGGLWFGQCPLTLAENKIRQSRGLPEIESFSRHYLRLT